MPEIYLENWSDIKVKFRLFGVNDAWRTAAALEATVDSDSTGHFDISETDGRFYVNVNYFGTNTEIAGTWCGTGSTVKNTGRNDFYRIDVYPL